MIKFVDVIQEIAFLVLAVVFVESYSWFVGCGMNIVAMIALFSYAASAWGLILKTIDIWNEIKEKKTSKEEAE